MKEMLRLRGDRRIRQHSLVVVVVVVPENEAEVVAVVAAEEEEEAAGEWAVAWGWGAAWAWDRAAAPTIRSRPAMPHERLRQAGHLAASILQL